MPVLLSPPEAAALLPVPGVRLGVTEAGVRKVNRNNVELRIYHQRKFDG